MRLDEVGAELAKLPEDRVPEGEDWAKLSAGRMSESTSTSLNSSN
jgi:hypothetical protein